MKINVLDLFSGIGGFTQGLKQAGFEIGEHYHAEIDKHANAIYKKQFPSAKLIGDVRYVRGDELGRVHAITFGSPCQDFSCAGQRAGLDGDRSSLISEAIRLITECRPDFFIWENVKGVFSSNDGRDFAAIIQAFANIGGYRLEWQLLNTAWFLPQNRERVYLVGRIADRCISEVFPIGSTGGKSNESAKGETVGCINTGEGRVQNSNTFIIQRPRGNNKGNYFNICPTISSSSFEHNNHLATAADVRKLTEIECERLQGFADNWTAYGDYDGNIKEVLPIHRYRCVGNAVTVNVAQAVASKILKGMELSA